MPNSGKNPTSNFYTKFIFILKYLFFLPLIHTFAAANIAFYAKSLPRFFRGGGF